jgi:hypothetical protein
VGTTSKILLTEGTLLPSLTKYSRLNPPQNGGGTGVQYTALVTIDGTTTKSVRFTGAMGDTITHVIDELNADLGASATAALTGGNIVITSATTGSTSSIKIRDLGRIFANLTGYVGIVSLDGASPTVYTATIVVDGVIKPIAVTGSAAQTIATLISEINTDLGASATAALTGGNIVVTSATTGAASTVLVQTSGTLFKTIPGFVRTNTATKGAADLIAALETTRAPSGTPLISLFHVKKVGVKPPVPSYVTHSLTYTYFDGTVWRYLDDDTAV